MGIGFFRTQMTIRACGTESDIAPGSCPRPWLVILGWNLTVMMHRDSAVAVAS